MYTAKFFRLILLFWLKIIIKMRKMHSVEEFNKGLNQYNNQIIYVIKNNIDDEYFFDIEFYYEKSSFNQRLYPSPKSE